MKNKMTKEKEEEKTYQKTKELLNDKENIKKTPLFGSFFRVKNNIKL